MKELNNIKNQIEARINDILNQELLKYHDNKIVTENINDFLRLSQGGKRIRGTLVYIGSCLKENKPVSYLDLAVAVELMQTAILIHDDIIDNAKTRRGEITINAKYSELGCAKGICVGDYGFFLAYRIISELDLKPKIKNQIINLFSTMMLNTVVGQMVDVESPYQQKQDEVMVEYIHFYKTAWYTIIGPLLLGASLNKLNKKLEQQILEFGTNLGIAFQIKDDMLSITSNDKCSNSDIVEGKVTLMYLYSKERTPELLKKYGDKSITQKEIENIKTLFIDNGAMEYATRKEYYYHNQAETILSKMKLSRESKVMLQSLIKLLLARQK